MFFFLAFEKSPNEKEKETKCATPFRFPLLNNSIDTKTNQPMKSMPIALPFSDACLIRCLFLSFKVHVCFVWIFSEIFSHTFTWCALFSAKILLMENFLNSILRCFCFLCCVCDLVYLALSMHSTSSAVALSSLHAFGVYNSQFYSLFLSLAQCVSLYLLTCCEYCVHFHSKSIMMKMKKKKKNNNEVKWTVSLDTYIRSFSTD